MNTIADIQVEKGIPVPPELLTKPGRRRYPFDALQINDSFFVPEELAMSYDTLRNTAYQYHSRARKMYVELGGDPEKAIHMFKMVIKAEPGGFRVWRVS